MRAFVYVCVICVYVYVYVFLWYLSVICVRKSDLLVVMTGKLAELTALKNLQSVSDPPPYSLAPAAAPRPISGEKS